MLVHELPFEAVACLATCKLESCGGADNIWQIDADCKFINAISTLYKKQNHSRLGRQHSASADREGKEGT